jgi:hypothetical protein
MKGIIGCGAYIPRWRLERASIGATLGSEGGKGRRSVASYDEDTTTMAVEAARLAEVSGLAHDKPAFVQVNGGVWALWLYYLTQRLGA